MPTPPLATGLDDVSFATATAETALLPEVFVPPYVNPAPGGLVNAVTWTEQTGPPRWVQSGVLVRASVTGNYGAEDSTGTWTGRWCSEPGSGDAQAKTGFRPDDPLPFSATVVWGADACDMSADSRAETQARAQQVRRMAEGPLVARDFAARMLDDAVPYTADDLTGALGEAEAIFADANVLGAIHVSPYLLPHMVSHMLAARGGVGTYTTVSGHLVIADGGYRDVLGDATLLLTSMPLFGWRDQVAVRDIDDYAENTYVAIAERSLLVAVEAVLGAVQIGGAS